MGRLVVRWLLATGWATLCVGAWVGGLSMALDPMGAPMGMRPELLAASPFPSFFWPGVVLLAGFGVLPLPVLFGLALGADWSAKAALGLGVLLAGWFAAQVLWIGFHPQNQLIWIMLCLSLCLLAWLLMRPARQGTEG